MTETGRNVIDTILKYVSKPPLFEPGEPRFWDDSHISKGFTKSRF